MINRIVLALAICVAAFAAPPEDVQVFVDGRAADGSHLGIGLADITADRAKALSLKEERGVEVTEVEDGSAAAKAGLQVGDVIADYNAARIEGAVQFRRLVQETPPGRTVKLGIVRNGRTQMISVQTERRQHSSDSLMRMLQGDMQAFNMPEIHMPEHGQIFAGVGPRLGVDAEAVSGDFAAYFGVKEGVLVRSVSRDSPADKAGLRAGDVITKIGGDSIREIGDISSALRSARSGSKSSVPVVLMREKREMTVNVTVPPSRSEQVRIDRSRSRQRSPRI